MKKGCNCGKPKPIKPRANLATVFGPYRKELG